MHHLPKTNRPFWKPPLGCSGNGDRTLRHNSLRDAFFSAANTVALAPTMEVPALIPGTSSWPGNIHRPFWKRGQPAALDVTVISTIQKETVLGASSYQGFSLRVGEERKMEFHAEACRAVGLIFIPLVVETLGGWYEESVHTLKSTGKLQGQQLGISPAETTRQLFQRLAISLWKENATS